MNSLLTAIAIVFLLEGALPLLAPDLHRRAAARVAALRPGQIRFVGFALCGVGGALLLTA